MNFWIEQMILFVKRILGFILWHLKKDLEIVIILSCQRSGSTLLKALLSEAPEIKHINEYDFQKLHPNKYIAYLDAWRINPKINSIILMKMPPNFSTYKSYPILPNIPHKTIILVRNPVDTLISLSIMNRKINNNVSDELLIQYWSTIYKNLLSIKSKENCRTIHYEHLLDNPIKVTEELFKFMNSKLENGVKTYHVPATGWQWMKDDGGEVIKTLKVTHKNKNYTNHQKLVSKIKASDEIINITEKYKT